MGPLPLLLGLGVWLGYLCCAGPTFYWLDSSEFVAASWTLGVAHPPGHPLALLLGRLCCLLPVGTLAFRVTLAAALQAAAATALMAVLAHQTLQRCEEAKEQPAWVIALASSFAAVVLGCSYALWLQAVRAEVYALNLLVIVAAASLALWWDRTGDLRALLLAGLVLALGLGNHHFLVLLAAPAVLGFVLLRPGRPGRKWRVASLAVAGVLGLALLVYLPLRARQGPEVNWGSPSTWSRFVWVVSAKAFHRPVATAAAKSSIERGGEGLFTLVRGFAGDSLLAPALALGAAAGLLLLLRRRQSRRVGLLCVGLLGLNLLAPLIVGLEASNPDAYGYLLVGLAALCPGLAVLVLAAAAALSGRGRRVRGALLAASCSAVLLLQLAANRPRVDLRGHWAAEETARQLLADLPAGSVLMSSYFETLFNLWALRATGDLRPDITLVHPSFVVHPGYVEGLVRRSPELQHEARRWQRAGHLVLEDLDALARQRPIYLEQDLHLGTDIVEHLQPAGLVLAFARGARDADLAEHQRRVLAWERALQEERTEPETRRAMLWTHYLLARFGCQSGLRALAQFHFALALRLAPEDRQLASLGARCRLREWHKTP